MLGATPCFANCCFAFVAKHFAAALARSSFSFLVRLDASLIRERFFPSLVRWMKGPLKDVPLEDRSGVVRVSKTPHGGVVLQAGTNPTIGDHNRVQDVSALALASKILEPALIEAPTGLPGMFDDHQSTLLWIRRFLDPQAWHENA